MITSIQYSDAGQYRCEATNTLGSDSINSRLVILRKLTLPVHHCMSRINHNIKKINKSLSGPRRMWTVILKNKKEFLYTREKCSYTKFIPVISSFIIILVILKKRNVKRYILDLKTRQDCKNSSLPYLSVPWMYNRPASTSRELKWNSCQYIVVHPIDCRINYHKQTARSLSCACEWNRFPALPSLI